MNILNFLARSERVALATLLTSLSLGALLSFQRAAQTVLAGNPTDVGWSAYNGGVNGDHYSELKQINVANAHLLKQVWRVDVGSDGGVQVNPLVVGRILYGYTPTLQVIAMDGATGKELWTFDSKVEGRSAQPRLQLLEQRQRLRPIRVHHELPLRARPHYRPPHP